MSPYYTYECPKCKAQRGEMRCIAQRHDSLKCPHCWLGKKEHVEMKLQIEPVKGFVKNPAAKS